MSRSYQHRVCILAVGLHNKRPTRSNPQTTDSDTFGGQRLVKYLIIPHHITTQTSLSGWEGWNASITPNHPQEFDTREPSQPCLFMTFVHGGSLHIREPGRARSRALHPAHAVYDARSCAPRFQALGTSPKPDQRTAAKDGDLQSERALFGLSHYFIQQWLIDAKLSGTENRLCCREQILIGKR